VDLGKLIAQLPKDWEWFSFLVQYCAGRNISRPFCQDFMAWALAAAALVVAFLALWILGSLWRALRNWMHRRMLAKVADAETMKKHVWSGYDSPGAVPSSEQRARKAGDSEKSK
jgi:ABC-type nickel/cobalt efflux system permease component RcnA